MQVFVLCGGFGTRLAHIVKDVPKPMAPIGDLPFLEIQLQQLRKAGASRFILLTGHKAEMVENHFTGSPEFSSLVHFSRETAPLGTGGALREALKAFPQVEPFAVANGDTFLDCSLSRLREVHLQNGAEGTLAVKYRQDCSRYGKIEPRGWAVAGFSEKQDSGSEGLINAGLYVFSPGLAPRIPADGFVSLENSVFPDLVDHGSLYFMPCEGRFIDIGVEDDYRTAQRLLPVWASVPKRKAAFLDRDGILIEDPGYLRRADDVRLRTDLLPLLKRLQDQDYLLIVCTNQAGIAKGKITPAEYQTVHARMVDLLEQEGIHLTDTFMCPFHEEAVLPQYRRASYCRKPQPGMILEAAEKHDVDLARSFMIGDKVSDRIELAGFRSYLLQSNYPLQGADIHATVPELTDTLRQMESRIT